jgi:hypothetical protein
MSLQMRRERAFGGKGGAGSGGYDLVAHCRMTVSLQAVLVQYDIRAYVHAMDLLDSSAHVQATAWLLGGRTGSAPGRTSATGCGPVQATPAGAPLMCTGLRQAEAGSRTSLDFPSFFPSFERSFLSYAQDPNQRRVVVEAFVNHSRCAGSKCCRWCAVLR